MSLNLLPHLCPVPKKGFLVSTATDDPGWVDRLNPTVPVTVAYQIITVLTVRPCLLRTPDTTSPPADGSRQAAEPDISTELVTRFLTNNQSHNLRFHANSVASSTSTPSAVSAMFMRNYHIALQSQRRANDTERDLWNIEREQYSKEREGYISKILRLEASVRFLSQRLDNEERPLFNPERRRLEARIRQLEATVQDFSTEEDLFNAEIQDLSSTVGKLQGTVQCLQANVEDHTPKNQPNSSPDPVKSRNSSAVQFTSLSFVTPSKDGTVQKNSDKDKSPTRIFSNSKSIALSRQTVPVPNTQTIQKPLIAGADIDKNLDGITFKASGVAPGIIKDVVSRSAPVETPTSQPTSRRSAPGMIEMPNALHLTLGELATKDASTMYAGNTPLARLHEPKSPETPPRRPKERGDSYFPANAYTPDSDPELMGQLGLTNDAEKDAEFLSELNSRLVWEASLAEEDDMEAGACI